MFTYADLWFATFEAVYPFFNLSRYGVDEEIKEAARKVDEAIDDLVFTLWKRSYEEGTFTDEDEMMDAWYSRKV